MCASSPQRITDRYIYLPIIILKIIRRGDVLARKSRGTFVEPAPQTRKVIKVTPIERIFAKLVGRKMNPSERRYFHLKSTDK
jgi:hypothetical protein